MQLTDTDLDTRFAHSMGELLGPDFPTRIGLAVSGGGDSMAMLALAHNWARVWGVELCVVTIDHGLRDESAAEAEMVAAECATLGHAHTTLRWHWDGQGNLQDSARRARLSLIGRWREQIDHVLMAHTADDLAETFLMRLARGSGVTGLAAMRPKRRLPDGYDIIRPCLGMTRAELRHYARTLQVPWAEDPSNDDDSYDRVRARKLLGTLADLGLDRDKLIATAGRMSRAEDALRARAVSVAQDIQISNPFGAVIFDRDGFQDVERDTQMRLLAAACGWVSGATYRPRAASLEDLLDRLLGGGTGTLMGAQAMVDKARVLIFREVSAIPSTPRGAGQLWDGRWKISGPQGDSMTVRALGESLKDVPDWRELGVPRAALLATPAVFQGETLVAAPAVGHNRDWSAKTVSTFITYLLSH